MWAILALGIVPALAVRATYRLFFHPLSTFPGPKIAAVSHLYEFYYDVIRNGTYIEKVDEMHQKYGPIVRINPRELHIKDSDYYERIYAGSPNRRDKDISSVAIFTTSIPMVGTIHHDHHRLRRSFLNTYFSKRSVKNMESGIQEKVDRLVYCLKLAHKTGTILELNRVFSAFTADVVTSCCFGASHSCLEQENFENQMIDAINYVMSMCHINKFLPLVPKLLRCIPQDLLQSMGLYMGDVIAVRNLIRIQAIDSLAKKSVLDNKDDSVSAGKTIFDALAAANVPPEEKTVRRLEEEAAAIFGAGTETTSRALSVAVFHLLNDEVMMLKLRKELQAVVLPADTPLTSTHLEQLPYLTGIIKEALRLPFGLVTRTPRISPIEPLFFEDYVIPPGTPVSQSAYFVHMDPEIFVHPKSFKPQRWINASKDGQYLNRYLVAFSKGTRQCLGMHLAYTELYLGLAAIA
ncbi:cytochrome P450 [Penicillium herquei]|nr:cytochrome P450 [Penicillium herquei]